MEDLASELTALFQETGRKHHEAFLDTDGFDPEWPMWYADYLEDRLPDLIGADLTRSELASLLERLSEEQPAKAPGTPWTRYYARFFVQRYT